MKPLAIAVLAAGIALSLPASAQQSPYERSPDRQAEQIILDFIGRWQDAEARSANGSTASAQQLAEGRAKQAELQTKLDAADKLLAERSVCAPPSSAPAQGGKP